MSGPGSTAAGYLLDTHVLLWWLAEPDRLPAAVRSAIADGGNRVCVSAAAAWELAIKRTLGRIDFPTNLEAVLAENRIDTLPITAAHALAVADLPLHHQDPFDRIQIAQARAEGLVFVTRDRQIERYQVEAMWA
jgi:PIN domain nuclease of toxin-antitoxin system